jgi:branched-chain amino acid transport system substrate-binding protein
MKGKLCASLGVLCFVLAAGFTFTPQAKADVTIGVIGPMTGEASQSGTNQRDAVALAIDEANARGGVKGEKLKMVVVDDEGNPTKSINGNNRLVHKEQAVVVIGSVQSSCTLANMAVTEKAGVPQITSISTSPAITQKGNKWIFRTASTDAIQAENVVKMALNALGKKRLAVIYVSTDYGRDASKVLLEICNKLGTPPVAVESFNAGDKDFSGQLLKIKEQNPDTLIIWGMYEEGALIAKQVAQMGLKAQLMGGGGLTNSKYVELGGAATNGTIMCQTYHPSSKDPLIAGFTERFQKKYGRLPDPNTAQTYDAMLIVIAAMEKAGVKDRSKIRDAIASTRNFKGVTGTLTFDATGDAPRDMMMIQVRNLNYELYKP